jgi:TonB-dependent Receptor Plug Domain
MRDMTIRHLLLTGLAGLLIGGHASAQDSSAAPDAGAGSEVFTAADFARYAPANALDMVRRVPGFAIENDDSGARGFGEARGNVLINGQRVSAKSNGVEAALRRIPASRVLRIEVIEGSELDIAGLSGKVVDVITDGDAGLDGSWRWRARFRENLPPSYDEFRATLSGARGPLSWTLEAGSQPERGANSGWRDITDGAGALIERRNEDFTFIADVIGASGSLAWKPASGQVANLNFAAEIFEANQKQVSLTFPEAGQEGRRLFNGSEDEWSAELGGDFEFAAGPGRLKLIGLARREHSPFVDRSLIVNVDGSNRFDEVFEQTIDEGESIVRSEYALKTKGGADWQVSAEGAFNYLDAESALFEAAGNGPLTEVPLGLADSRVEERRAEIIFSHGRQLAPKLNFQLSAGAEYSELSQTGDAENIREFTRPKGSATLTWQQSESLKLVTRIERRVGQLDFFDFISSVNLEAENGVDGNPEIVPSQSWRLNMEAEKDFRDWGASTVRLIFAELEDVVDQVPIGTGAGPGNLERGSLFGIETDTTIKLSKIGFAGAELTFNGGYYDTEVDDPVTGVSRAINGHLIYEYEAALRHDIPNSNWAWGTEIEGRKTEPRFRVERIAYDANMPAFALAFVEHKNLSGLTGRVTVGNLFNQRDIFWREIYAPDRNGALVRREESSRGFGGILTLELRGTF